MTAKRRCCSDIPHVLSESHFLEMKNYSPRAICAATSFFGTSVDASLVLLSNRVGEIRMAWRFRQTGAGWRTHTEFSKPRRVIKWWISYPESRARGAEFTEWLFPRTEDYLHP